MMLVTVSPIVFRSSPVLEAIMPLPTPEITPKVVYRLVSHSYLAKPRRQCSPAIGDLMSKKKKTPMSLTSGNQNKLHLGVADQKLLWVLRVKGGVGLDRIKRKPCILDLSSIERRQRG